MAPIVPIEALEQVASGVDHAEGICLSPDGTVHVSGEKGQIYRVEPDGSAREVATTGGWTLGLAADGDGRIYACDPVRHAICRWTPGARRSRGLDGWRSSGAPPMPELGRVRAGRELLVHRLGRLEGAGRPCARGPAGERPARRSHHASGRASRRTSRTALPSPRTGMRSGSWNRRPARWSPTTSCRMVPPVRGVWSRT